jgi:hypothetical protein
MKSEERDELMAKLEEPDKGEQKFTDVFEYVAC